MEKGSVLMQFLAGGSATMVYMIYGTFTGWATPMIPRLLNSTEGLHLSSDQTAWVTSSLYISQAVLCIPAGFVADKIGRKKTMLIGALPYLLAWILTAVATSAELLYVARILAGLAVGSCTTIAPMYIGEIADDHVRGALGTLFMVMMSSGILFEEVVGPYVSPTVLASISAIFPVLFALTFMWMPETPYYFLAKKKREDAEKSLLRLRGLKNPESVKEDLHAMEIFVEENSHNKGRFKDLFTHPGNRKGLILMAGLLIFQNLSGIFAITSYATVIFEDSGISLDADIAVIIMGVLQVVLSVVSSSTVDKSGRRPVLLVSTVGCSFALIIEGVFYYLKSLPESNLTGYDWVPLCAMVLYYITLTLGVGPVPISIVAELFPTNVKSIAMSLATATTAIQTTIIVKLFQVVADAYGKHVVFWGFAVCTGINFVFVLTMVPETKGKSLMEIHRELSSSKKLDDLETS